MSEANSDKDLRFTHLVARLLEIADTMEWLLGGAEAGLDENDWTHLYNSIRAFRDSLRITDVEVGLIHGLQARRSDTQKSSSKAPF